MAEYFVSEQLQAVAAARGESCSKMRARLLQVARKLTLATACSGTDSPVVLAKLLGLKHGFSCEFDVRKVEWILENFPETQALFKDIKTLKNREVVDLVSNEKVQVPESDIFITGFVCKSVSTENNNREKYKNCIKEVAGETGETFSGMMGYVRKQRPLVVIAENVRGITCHNKGQPPVIEHVAEAMKRAGYRFDYRILNTQDFMIPQRRPRCWMVGLRADQFDDSHVKDVFQLVESMKRKAPTLKKYFQHFQVGQRGMPAKGPNARQKKVIKAGLKRVSGRKRSDEVLIDLAKSETRCPTALNHTPCIVANSNMYWQNEGRFLSAEEAMALQGIFAKDFKKSRGFFERKRSLCNDMTGNAFSMSVCSAVLQAVLITLASKED